MVLTLSNVAFSDNRINLDTPEGSINIEAKYCPSSVTSLQPLLLTIDIEKPNILSLEPNQINGSYGDFNVEYIGQETRKIENNRSITTRRLRLFPSRYGKLVIPPIPFQFNSNISSKSDEKFLVILPAEKYEIPISTGKVNSIDSIVPNLEPIAPPTSWTKSLIILLLVLIITVFIYFRKHRVTSIELNEISQEIPSVKALRLLDELKKSTCYLNNEPNLCVQISEILRCYLFEEYNINTEEKTSREILDTIDSESKNIDLDQMSLSFEKDANTTDISVEQISQTYLSRKKVCQGLLKTPEIRALLVNLLEVIDLVKFAKVSLSFNEASHIFTKSREFVIRASEQLDRQVEINKQKLQEITNISKSTQNPQNNKIL